MRRARFIGAQVTARLDPRASGLQDPAAMLLTAADLGPTWRQIDRRTWRTGMGGTDADWATRARALRGTTEWVSFEDEGEERWLWAQSVPLASPDDAGAALATVWSAGRRNLGAAVELGDHVEFDPEFDGTTGARGRRYPASGNEDGASAVMVAFVVRSVVGVISLSAGDDVDWPAQEFRRCATRQIERTARALGA